MNSDVPAGWQRESLASLGSLLKGRGGPRSDDQPSGVPVVRYGELYTRHNDVIRGFFSFISTESADRYARLKSGDLLFAGSGETADEIGKSAVFVGPEPAYAAGDTIIFRPNGGLDPLFLGYASNGPVANAFKMCVGQGSSVMHIYARDLENLTLAVPPLPEQRKIAAILSSVDDAIAATRKVIEQTKRVKQGLLQTLMTRGIGHTCFKKTEIGEIPESWELRALPELGTDDRPMLKAGPFGSSLKKQFYRDTGYKIYGQEQVLSGDASFGDYYIDEGRYRALESCSVRPGDVLVSLVGTPGKSLVLNQDAEPGVINPRIVRLSPDSSRVDSHYLSFWLSSSRVRNRLASLRQGGTMDILNSKMLSSLRMACPPINEQKAIVRRLHQFERALMSSMACADALAGLKRGLMQDLLTGRVRVQPD